MMPTGPPDDELRRAVDDAEGIARLHKAIDQRDAEQARWEADHPGLRYGQMCDCYCQLRGHGSRLCGNDAVTFEVLCLHGQPVQVPLCQPCADANLASEHRSGSP